MRKKGEKALEKIREGKSTRSAVSEATQSGFKNLVSELFKAGPHKNPKEKELELQKPKEQGVDQVAYDAVQNKIQKQPFLTNIRVVASAESKARAEEILHNLISSFSQFSLSAINSLEAKEVKGAKLKKFIYEFSFRLFNKKQGSILNIEELASIYHFPRIL